MSFSNLIYVSNSVDTFSSNCNAYYSINNFPPYSNGKLAAENGASLGAPDYDLLPSFKDVPSAERQNLFVRKMSICSVVFDFSDPLKNLREKEVKRKTLLELVDYLSSASLKFDETTMQEIRKMMSANLFRALPAPKRYTSNLPADVFEVDGEEPGLESSWPHIQIVYAFLLRFVASKEVDGKVAKRCIDHSFVLRLLELFDVEDQREREFLKTIVHRIYGKFVVHRPFIRKAISNILCQFIFETEKHNGIAELLEILGSIINGFVLPLKQEHTLFLVRVLIPLHKPKCISMYHQQLLYCITQFAEKDITLADIVIRGILKYWPVTNSSKEVMFLGELEEVLESTQESEFQKCMVPLFHQIGRCLSSSHFQVAERALSLWNNDHIRHLITDNRCVVLPIIFKYIERNSCSHWNQSVQTLALSVRKAFCDADPELFDECLVKFEEDKLKEEDLRDRHEEIWKRLEDRLPSNTRFLLEEPKSELSEMLGCSKDEELENF